VMALFGVLNSDSDDKQTGASAAVKAAMAVRKQFEVVLSKWTEQWKLYEPRKIELGLGCGIHTGEALVGNVGTDFRDQFTALGPHVNFASRLCAKADAGQILISQTAKMRLDKGTKTRPAGEISNVKNIVGTFALFSV